jgi:Protein of unknown function
MDQDEAAEILEHLLDAAFAIDEARAAILTLGKDDQEEFAASIETIETALHSKLRRTIYDRFPDLMEFDEFPEISSALRWDQVRLPPSVSEAQIDQIIFSVMIPQWRKMALMVGDAFVRCKEVGLPISAEVVAARIQALVEAGRLEGEGDLRRWRHSEVRLKG